MPCRATRRITQRVGGHCGERTRLQYSTDSIPHHGVAFQKTLVFLWARPSVTKELIDSVRSACNDNNNNDIGSSSTQGEACPYVSPIILDMEDHATPDENLAC